jgi:hypothetical protein
VKIQDARPGDVLPGVYTVERVYVHSTNTQKTLEAKIAFVVTVTVITDDDVLDTFDLDWDTEVDLVRPPPHLLSAYHRPLPGEGATWRPS